MNTDMIDTCRRLRTNFADNSFVKNLKNELGRLTDYAPHIEVNGKEYPLGSEKEIMLLWICQEAFNNVIQHSLTKELNVTIHYDQSSFSLNIKDEGIGFDQKELNSLAKTGKGFQHMFTAARMINSQLIVKSQPHKGTSISIRLQTLST
jgi:signal transduction histidine kinase